jgi:hypothetical protein
LTCLPLALVLELVGRRLERGCHRFDLFRGRLLLVIEQRPSLVARAVGHVAGVVFRLFHHVRTRLFRLFAQMRRSLFRVVFQMRSGFGQRLARTRLARRAAVRG